MWPPDSHRASQIESAAENEKEENENDESKQKVEAARYKHQARLRDEPAERASSVAPVGQREADIEEKRGESESEKEEDEDAQDADDQDEDDQLESLQTVRSASLDRIEAQPSNETKRVAARHDRDSMGSPLELSAQRLLEDERVRSQEELVEVELASRCDQERKSISSSHVELKHLHHPQQSCPAAPLSMYEAGSGSGSGSSFRYCYRERATGGINYPTNERQTAAREPEDNRMSCGRGFSEAQPKLWVTSKRLKEYFESLKSRRTSEPGSRGHYLYQFFKSTRTELVACLLFSVIVYQTLITCRIYANERNLLWAQEPFAWPSPPQQQQQQQQQQQLNQAPQRSFNQENSPAQTTIQQQLKWPAHSENLANNNKLGVHLIVGFVSSLTVATLTQVFGHISGCHLLPSVSLALYFKGHISRARLVSYLAAQSAGSLAGVALLGLLTSSQTVGLVDHRRALSEARSQWWPGEPATPSGQIISPSNRLMRQRRWAARGAVVVVSENLSRHQSEKGVRVPGGAKVIRRRARSLRHSEPQPQSQLAPLELELENDLPAEPRDTSAAHANGLIRGSEGILLSIMEQKERELNARQQHQQPSKISANTQGDRVAEAEAEPTFSARQQAGVLFNGISKSATDTPSTSSSQSGGSQADTSRPEPAHERAAAGATTWSPSNNTIPGVQLPGSSSESRETSRPSGAELVVQNGTTTTTTTTTTLGSPAVPISLVMVPLVTSQTMLEYANEPANIVANVTQPSSGNENSRQLKEGVEMAELATSAPATGEQKLAPEKKATRIKAGKKRARRQQQSNSSAALGRDHVTSSFEHSNLLRFALPDAIMSSESMRECLRDNYLKLAKWTPNGQLDPSTMRQVELANCSGLSNASQMFIFQLLATLLVVLTYLVNVDPRRVDLGFKSLSIGLAYFLAHALTLNSGGFYGNPLQLLALFFFGSTSPAGSIVWQGHWLVYLVVPLIGGLFGALSHEYIDFTSLRNRNKQLHLRRSFFSLDDLAAPIAATEMDANGSISQKGRAGLEANELAKKSSSKLQGAASGTHEDAKRREACGAHLSASSVASSLAGSSGSSSSHESSLGARSSVITLNMTSAAAAAADDDVERAKHGTATAESQPQRRNQSLAEDQERRSHQTQMSSSPKSGCSSIPSSRQTVSSDLLLDSNFLICCSANYHASRRHKDGRRLQSGQSSLASSLACRRRSSDGRFGHSAPMQRQQRQPQPPPPPPFCVALSGDKEPRAGQFVRTSQFM